MDYADGGDVHMKIKSREACGAWLRGRVAS